MKHKSFKEDLAYLINYYSCENGSDTPDFILAEYIDRCLRAFEWTTRRRDRWYKFRPWKDNDKI